ncbi:tRNA (adenosine(37)-N6)-threonylcarbamoyltransferase complex ATPase subunit type 1 TsaE [Patescibacteria group bacterium]|nr:tRNA (adenosine(37)-N6)-threonylcarbamoyltransferase complex ATPase subunit type 1 TsaE [Patescibacteria group bacterium]MBU1721749.1 tRNA (adenosine(37)-N6)-threonylcarbamoyltransferase complex ATPase subunit type 1 TsaE [Patescibacteria group bacterium]MBU1901412.1 tRNA (adenosine(37)-N6)-threonylcarbamoyltransferase complex ATPase subunit type 1 TsaE [Patescibacteria group bacterium]
MEIFNPSTEEEQIAIGRQIASTCKAGDILLLQGDLGAGKTTLSKGIAQGLGLTEPLTSPTFTLMNLYELPQEINKITELVHIDTYRLEDEEGLKDIGVEDYLGSPNTLCIIEWPGKITELLKNKKTILLELEHTKDGGRMIKKTV